MALLLVAAGSALADRDRDCASMKYLQRKVLNFWPSEWLA